MAATKLALYNLTEDAGERHSVADQHPDIVELLKDLGEKAREELGDGKRKGKGVRPRER